MFKTTFNTLRLEKKDNRQLKNVTQITFSNYHKVDECFVEINGFKRQLPAAQFIGITAVPVSWSISSDTPFDISFEATFANAAGNLVVDYLEQKC